MQERGIAIIIQNGKILLMHRVKNGRDYYVFPGGSVENNEDPQDTTIRELKEEFSIDIIIDQKLFELTNTVNERTRLEHYFFVKDFLGTPTIGGEEKDRMTENNIYEPIWINLSDLNKLALFPEPAKVRIIELFLNQGGQWNTGNSPSA